ncbi:MAG: DUF2207 domain-containing protein [Candidatus Omnitrophica bacterium]|nr:DUF2207 domain-containing protein [Candidatus Omnitrophota bacterium]
MKEKKIFFLLAAFILFLALPFYALAQGERILSYESDIKINMNGSMEVAETIKVTCTGNQIKRGIYRDFPTKYRDRLGNNYVVDFDVQRVLRDGISEPYHFENLSNGRRVYIGRKDIFLKPGEYAYTIVYRTNRQLGFFQDFDELYWNVTGNGWAFPIDYVQANIELPKGARVLNADAYTGAKGSRGRDFSYTTNISGNPSFSTTRTLAPQEGLTIVVSWPKGYVQEPTAEEKFGYFLKDNMAAFVGFVGLLIVLAYYLLVWAKVGKDPERGTIIPLFEPEKGFSPAAMRYIMKMGYDNKIFTATIINMAVKGYLKIIESNGVFTIERLKADESVLNAQEKLISRLLLGSDNRIVLKNANHTIVSGTITKLKQSLKNNYEKIYFLTNFSYFLPGVMLSLLIVFASAASAEPLEGKIGAFFISIWLTIWSFGVVMLVRQAASLWKGALSASAKRFSSLGGAIFLSIFSIPFIIGELVGMGALAAMTSIAVVFVMIALVFVNVLFHHLLKAPTRAGRRLMDKIEGFKLYLSVAEKERMNFLNPPEKTPELFEKYLPYALALDVEQPWSEQFSEVLEKAAQAGQAYSPGWYSGSSWNSLGSRGFASGIGSSLSGAIASSSTAPGSSGGGGGSSGGGGGGGGGGGW